jgi:TonB family protein
MSSLQGASSWERINTEDEDFSIHMPARPTVHVQRAFNISGVKFSGAAISTAYHDGVVFIARIYEAPNLTNLTRKCPQIVGISKKATPQKISIGNYQGEEYLESGDNYYRYTRCFTTTARFYVVEAAARNETDPNIKRFLSSLELGGMKVIERSNTVSEEAGTSNQPLATLPTDSKSIFAENEVTRPAVIIYKPMPVYNPIAKAARISGKVKIKLVLSASGEVSDIEVLKGQKGGLADGVIPVLKHIKFLPAQNDGRLVSQYAEVEYNFVID